MTDEAEGEEGEVDHMPGFVLAPRQDRPQWCMECGTKFFMRANQAVSIRFLQDGNGRVLWYFIVCHACFWAMPEKWRLRAVEPPRTPPPFWHRTLPVPVGAVVRPGERDAS